MEIEFLRNALRFDNPQLPELNSAQWKRVLAVADRERLTLALGQRWKGSLPESVAARIDQNRAANALRLASLRDLYAEIADELQSAGVEFAVLKGFSHGLDRPVGDLDLFCRQHSVFPAQEALARLGYLPLAGTEDVPTDHVPPRMRPTPWVWRGDYFDLEAPIAVELHYQLWDQDTERMRLEGLDEFWFRRRLQCADGFCFPALAGADRIGYAALHLVRHVLRGDFRLFHAYELAQFLHGNPGGNPGTDETFPEFLPPPNPGNVSSVPGFHMHSDSVRRVEALGFRFAADWFGCRVPDQVASEWEQFPDATRRWFEHFAQAPLQAKRHPNKTELWLHLSLLPTPRDRRAVAARRLVPVRRQKTQFAAHVPPKSVTWRLRIQRRTFQARYSLQRVTHHVRSTVPTLVCGARLFFHTKGLDWQLFGFLFATSLFNVGMGIYFLLHNLFLLDRGFHEDSLGAVSSALGVGSLTGAMPAAFGLQRYGVRRMLILTFAGVPLVSAIRILWNTPEVLIGSAFAGGFLMSLYAVSLAPTIAQWTTEAARPFAFSLVFSLGIGLGILSSLIGGHLPAVLSLRNALLVSCLIAASGALVASRLKLDARGQKENRIYPRSPFVRRFLTAMFLWSLATGAFNPFFSAYFSQVLHFRVGEIGFVSAAGQGVQVAALLCAPLLLSRLGPIAGVMSMQVATAIALALLSLGSSGWISATLYALYMGFQYMSEPGLYSLLMDEVAPHERGGAAALNFVVISGTQALAAVVSGFCIKSLGYVPVLLFAALIAVFAALTFRSLVKSVPEAPGSLACSAPE